MDPRASLVTILQPVYHPFERVVDHLPVAVPKLCGPITLGRAGSFVA